ncbi:MAG: flagellar biosynthetic protein FliR [Candidatus Melainabacteria bacterium]|nr:flagellar biosynthetic protein FliR [Candidatus Melainabacteria bacterium]
MFDIFLNQTKLLEQFGGVWIIGLLVFTRTMGFAATAPLIGSKQIPALVKISFAIVITLIIFPLIDVPPEYPRNYEFIYYIVINATVGMLVGWISSLILEIGRVAGEMLDMQMGLNAATMFDPVTQSQTTIVGHFFEFIALTIFISVGGMEKTLEGLYKSYNTFPVVFEQINFNLDKIIKATAELIAIGFLIVSPIVVIILAVDLILGLMSRAAPQINAFQISFSIKPTLGLLLLMVLLPALLEIFAKLFNNPNRYF